MTKGHNDHMPDPALTAKYRVTTNAKAAARANVLAPSGQIIDQQLTGLTQEEVSKVPRRSAIQRAVNRARDHVQGGAVDRAPELMQIPPVFQQTKDGQQFLRVDSRQNEPQAPAFLDGTFFCRPKHFAQLYVIGVFKQRSFVPCAYFLLPNKQAATYQHAFNAFFTLPELHNASPTVLMADFEVAPSSAMKELFPGVRVVHCQFHLAQNLLKHIREAGLVDVYRNDARGVLVAPLFPPNSWNVNEAVVEDGARTNNSQEGWNRGFNARFQRSKGKLSKFLLRLQEDEEQTRQLLDRWDVFPGEPARGRRRHKTVICDSQIRTMVIEYNALAATDRTPEAKMELLRRIQFHLST